MLDSKHESLAASPPRQRCDAWLEAHLLKQTQGFHTGQLHLQFLPFIPFPTSHERALMMFHDVPTFSCFPLPAGDHVWTWDVPCLRKTRDPRKTASRRNFHFPLCEPVTLPSPASFNTSNLVFPSNDAKHADGESVDRNPSCYVEVKRRSLSQPSWIEHLPRARRDAPGPPGSIFTQRNPLKMSR